MSRGKRCVHRDPDPVKTQAAVLHIETHRHSHFRRLQNSLVWPIRAVPGAELEEELCRLETGAMGSERRGLLYPAILQGPGHRGRPVPAASELPLHEALLLSPGTVDLQWPPGHRGL